MRFHRFVYLFVSFLQHFRMFFLVGRNFRIHGQSETTPNEYFHPALIQTLVRRYSYTCQSFLPRDAQQSARVLHDVHVDRIAGDVDEEHHGYHA